MVALLVFAQVPEPYGQLTQYGVAGILAVLLIRRYEGELARERAARERAEQQRDLLAERAATEIIPLLGEVQRTMVPTLERLGDRLESVERVLRER